MPIFDEAFLEPLARRVRFQQGIKHVPMGKPIDLVDLGCGPKIRFYYFAKNKGIKINQYTGVDPLVTTRAARTLENKSISIINKTLSKKIPLKSESAHVVTAFAFFEHIDHPKQILAEAYRILRPGGKIILTTPSYKAKALLELLAYKLNIISKREIAEHKRYFDHYSLIKLLPTVIKRIQMKHKYFEFRLNNLLVITK
jgi:ubiquinone/menaquinone biosynthesis C-methylase UbiE